MSGYFGDGGPLSARLGSAYRPRPQQQQLVDTIKSLQRREMIAINAPVAVGKNDALGVAILESGLRGVLSTQTLTLLDQLEVAGQNWAQDFPEKKIRTVRGRQNYCCDARLEELTREHEAETALGLKESPRARRRLKIIEHGRQNDLLRGGPEGVEELRQSNCPGRQRCTKGDVCRYYRARDDAADADLVITSHKMVLTMLDYPRMTDKGPEYWFPLDIWVADEGDELIAAVQDGQSISGRGLRAALNDRRCTKACYDAIRRFADNLSDLLGQDRSMELDQRSWQGFVEARLPAIKECLLRWPEDPEEDESLGRQAVRSLVRLLETMQGTTVRAGFRCERRALKQQLSAEDKRLMTLHVTWQRIDLGDQLQRYASQFERFAAVSGSMALPTKKGMSHDFFARRSHIELTARHSITSPIDYDKNLRIVHAPIARSQRDRHKVFAQFCANLAVQVGECLILCTSYQTVRAVQEAFEAIDLPILAQEQGSVETVAALTAQVKAGHRSSIVGNKSAWVGLDLDARYKTTVVIERVPLPSPDVDLTMAGYLRRLGDAAAWGEAYGRPQALKQAVQGVGRTLRRETDRCLLVVCDDRYRTDFRLAIPGGREVTMQEGIEWARSIRDTQQPMAAKNPPDTPLDELLDQTVSDDFGDFLQGAV